MRRPRRAAGGHLRQSRSIALMACTLDTPLSRSCIDDLCPRTWHSVQMPLLSHVSEEPVCLSCQSICGGLRWYCVRERTCSRDTVPETLRCKFGDKVEGWSGQDDRRGQARASPSKMSKVLDAVSTFTLNSAKEVTW